MFEATTQRAHARAGRLVCASRKSGGGGKARGEEDYPNIIEEPIRIIKIDEGGAGKSGGKKSGKGGASGKGARRAGKGSAKKRRG
jgi:hypothetical protein